MAKPLHERIKVSKHLDEAVGQIAVNTVIEGSLVKVDNGLLLENKDCVLVWSATACEQIGRAVLDFLESKEDLPKTDRLGQNLIRCPLCEDIFELE